MGNKTSRVNLYLCGKKPQGFIASHTDGVNLYKCMTEHYENHIEIFFHRSEARNGFNTAEELFSTKIIYDAGLMATYIHYCYRFIGGRTYVIMLFVRGTKRGGMFLIRDGDLVDNIKTPVVGGSFTKSVNRAKNGYFTNIIGRICKDNVIIEYFIDSALGKIREQKYMMFNIRNIYNIFSDETRICAIGYEAIDIICKQHPDTIHRLNQLDGFNWRLSSDGKYIYTTSTRKHDDKIVSSVYTTSSFRKIADYIYIDASCYRLSGDVNGVILFSNECEEMIIGAVMHNRFVELANRRHEDALVITPFGKIGSPGGNLYQFAWDWRFYHMQRPEIKRIALYIFMTLTLRCGVVKHIAMIIGEIAMSP